MQQLKRIDLNTGVFQANGITYRIEQQLSVERYCEFQVLQKELGYGMSFQALYDKMSTMYALMNQTRLVDAAVILNDILQGLAKIEQKEPTVMKVCALFINAEEEDRTIYTEDMVTKKIADWKKEGIAMDDFFAVALNLVPGYLKIYSDLTRAISEGSGNLVGALKK